MPQATGRPRPAARSHPVGWHRLATGSRCRRSKGPSCRLQRAESRLPNPQHRLRSPPLLAPARRPGLMRGNEPSRERPGWGGRGLRRRPRGRAGRSGGAGLGVAEERSGCRPGRSILHALPEVSGPSATVFGTQSVCACLQGALVHPRMPWLCTRVHTCLCRHMHRSPCEAFLHQGSTCLSVFLCASWPSGRTFSKQIHGQS